MINQPIAITACRSCGSDDLMQILSLGEQTISCFPAPGEPVHRAPIDLMFCQSCTLLQLGHCCPSDWFYRWYGYRSGINPMMVEALSDIVTEIQHRVPLVAGDVVVDIGSNDGSFLRLFQAPGIHRVGFDPALNLALEGGEGLSLFINDYFSAQGIQPFLDASGKAKVVTAIAMFYDLHEPRTFLEDVRAVLDPSGLFVLQMNYLVPMLEVTGYDNLCHEHVAHYSLLSLRPLIEATGFRILDVATNSVNGGSFRLYCTRSDGPEPTEAGLARIADMELSERCLRLTDIDTYRQFGKRVEQARIALSDVVRREKSQGKRIYVYGASTRGLVIMQACGLDSSLIDGAAERNPEKWGRMYAGTGIKCVPEDEAREQADYFLILPWIFLDEFVRREEAFLRRGGKFIVPLPTVSIISYLSTSPISLLKEVHFMSVKAA
jgi:SAM-dependent methyltransferase